MIPLALAFLLAPLVLVAYCWIIYPMILPWLHTEERDRSAHPNVGDPPPLTIVIAAHNAARELEGTLRAIIACDYPSDRRQVLVVSDGSRDDTARVVREFRRHNVHLLQSRRRRGKTSCENLAAPRACGDFVVCMDANVRIDRGALQALVREFSRPGVGVVSGIDVAIADTSALGMGERAYICAEMWLRNRESPSAGLIGASGCFYAMRRTLFTAGLRPSLTRDFAVVLLARRAGLRAVVASEARCRMQPANTARAELARKARTMVQGLETLAHFRDLMNPIRHGRFAFALISHKLCRWIIPLFVPPALVAAAYLCATKSAMLPVLGVAIIGGGASMLALLRSHGAAFIGYAVLVQLAAIVAWGRFLRGKRIVTWTPTPRRSLALRALR